MNKTNSESAVSPVVGVMLMLVVTLILASVVGAFVGGAESDMKNAPQASISVYTEGTDDFNIFFEHKGGEPIRTRDIEIITWIEMSDGSTIKHKQRYESPTSNITKASGSVEKVRVPYLYDVQKGAIDKKKDWFGKAVWMPGNVAETGGLRGTAEFLGLPEDDLKDCIKEHAILEVKILHAPSGKYILNTKTILRE